MGDVWSDTARDVSNEWAAEGRLGFEPNSLNGDDLAFWEEVERRVRSVSTSQILEWTGEPFIASLHEAGYREDLHPRNRLGRWIKGLGFPHVFEVGGAVRDELLNKEPKDIDYMAMASPEEIAHAVELDGGVAHPLMVRDQMVGVRAVKEGITPPGGVEIAPPRVEMSTGEGRHDFVIVPHPEVVDPTGVVPGSEIIYDDAHRRDFTINALYRDEDDDVVDPTGRGLADLEHRVLRTTHESSFRDDPLRILRGARFASVLGFDVADDTMRQMRENADAVTALTQKGVSGSVLIEMDKLLMGKDPARGLRVLRDSGTLKHLFPEVAPIVGYDQQSVWHDLTLDEHTFRVVDEVARQGGSLEARWAALLHDIGKPDVAFIREGEDPPKKRYYAAPENDMVSHEEAGVERAHNLLNRINAPDALKRRVLTIIREHMLREADAPTAVKARRMRARLNDEEIADLLVHRRADMRSKGEDDDPIPTPAIDKLEELVAQAAQEGAPRSLADLRIKGTDIINLGGSGPQIGSILDELLREVVNQPNVNRHEWLLTRAAKMLRAQ